MSGDQADLLLHHVLGRRRVCVEVKSRISPEGDLIRGIFQCVKYQSVLEAEEKYISASDEGKVARQIQVLLATEMELSPRLRELCGILHVKAVTVKIPKEYMVPA